MQVPALCCCPLCPGQRSSVQRCGPCGYRGRGARCGGAVPAGTGAEELRAESLLQSLRQLREEEGEPSLGAEPGAGAEDGGCDPELPAPVPAPALPGQPRDRASEGVKETPVLPPTETLLPLLRDEDEESRSADGLRWERSGESRGCRWSCRCPRLKASERLPPQLSELLSQVSGADGGAEAGTGCPEVPESPFQQP
ncbi:uncharacterized protein LOC131587432 isoform X2 [Poecile atricapillus]|uniref:uncharacterized protein LOC131587432 isoform X2 n=1 Tax=Poecile atricapillus TaxID=48891 RepID=UPI002739BC21|nr:uncharacterized protein LOC131587432 isoform X2 [Poecile atricapillus]